MYVPKHFEEPDRSVLHGLIRAHPLGTWVTQGDGELIANHLPFLLDPARGPNGTLLGHVARSNRVWRSLSTAVASVVVFQGPEAYVTPSWYPSKSVSGEVVPTWNYAVVHAHGIPRVIQEGDWLLDLVTRLTDVHESGRALPWKVADAPRDFVDRLIRAIVGIEIPVERLVGKWKVSQNRPESDRLGVATGLLARDGDRSDEMASLLRRTVSGDGG